MRFVEAVGLALGVVLAGCAADLTALHTAQSPEEWKRVEVNGRFSFPIPPEMKPTAAQGADSSAGEYVSPEVRLGYDYGWYSDPLEYKDRVDHRESLTEIAGKKAKYVTYRRDDDVQGYKYFAGVHFPDVGDGQNRLTVWARFREPSDLDRVERIFRSIKFAAP